MSRLWRLYQRAICRHVHSGHEVDWTLVYLAGVRRCIRCETPMDD
jgi:hypothetical protein